MGERKPGIAPPITDALKIRQNESLVQQVRKYRLITPLFGGGVDPGVNDEITPISGKAIRGHLRFWWRATRGGQYNACLKDMKQAEESIWGGASGNDTGQPSTVNVAVKVINKGTPKQPFTVEQQVRHGALQFDRRGQKKPELKAHETVAPAYLVFPLQPPTPLEVGKHTEAVREGVVFELKISFPAKYKEDVEAALWAWETFGGIGARTRRGFGALQLESCEVNGDKKTIPPMNDPAREIPQKLACYIPKELFPENVPHLALKPRLKITGARPKAHMAWKHLSDALRDFRQSRSDREGQPSKYGKSDWPEPDAIKRYVLDLNEEDDHEYFKFKKAPPEEGIDKFPRAVLGLPIIFHFPQEKAFPDATLKGVKDDRGGKDDYVERMSSPLILRPLAIGNGRFVGLAMILEAPQRPPQGFILEWQPLGEDAPETWNVKEQLTSNEADRIHPLSGKTNVLQAFLDNLR
ncbi:MAG: CRISPR-associated protein Cmr1 [Blastocatellia bacterium]